MADGPAGFSHRTLALNKEREDSQKQLEQKKTDIKAFNQSGLGTIDSRFKTTDPVVEEELAARTVGLVSKEEFKRRRDLIDPAAGTRGEGKKRKKKKKQEVKPVSYTHLRAHETPEHLVCRLLLEKKKKKNKKKIDT
eukprot:TRINITY_DN56105_c0_g1_i1.p1 TRINITY_DN56105_c0_g1~~TRINITY_DN56105_c0_g1_i1.p1  ORF type:complete len:137 (-),score=53.58 TRINITY_DN56105_c0_g1_i1:105-515(-)